MAAEVALSSVDLHVVGQVQLLLEFEVADGAAERSLLGVDVADVVFKTRPGVETFATIRAEKLGSRELHRDVRLFS